MHRRYGVPAQTHAPRYRLRNTDPCEDSTMPSPAVPVERTHEGMLAPFAQLAFDRRLNAIVNAIGGWERIASTPCRSRIR